MQWTSHVVNASLGRFLRQKLRHTRLVIYVLRLNFNGCPATKIGITDARVMDRLKQHASKPHYGPITVKAVHELRASAPSLAYATHDVLRGVETAFFHELRRRSLSMRAVVPGRRTPMDRPVTETELVHRKDEAVALRMLQRTMDTMTATLLRQARRD